jgi:monovalent cation:H+ antiporter, CPA1 family
MNVESFFRLVALVVTLAAVFGYLNHRWIRLPHTIGLVVIALFASLVVIALDYLVPALGFRQAVRGTLARIDFHDALMKGMLSFLLFAGALHVDLGDLARRKWAISLMATAGVMISTFLIGGVMYLLLPLLGAELPLIWCLVFGSLISPTDPVAVLGILKTVKVPQTLEAIIAGESLFNDGVGVVVFAIMVAIATGGGGHGPDLTPLGVAGFFLAEAAGGAVLGVVCGYGAFRAMRAIDEHNLEVLITLSLVMVAYGVAPMLHVSGPIAVVVAGLLIGNHGSRLAMSERTRDHVHKFWSLMDEILNSALFLIIGFEVVALRFDGHVVLPVLAVIPIVLAARFTSVALPITVLSLGPARTYSQGVVPVLTWGGLRGGISVALALSLPAVAAKDIILAMTYGVVIFSIVVQGLSIGRVIGWATARENFPQRDA